MTLHYTALQEMEEVAVDLQHVPKEVLSLFPSSSISKTYFQTEMSAVGKFVHFLSSSHEKLLGPRTAATVNRFYVVCCAKPLCVPT